MWSEHWCNCGPNSTYCCIPSLHPTSQYSPPSAFALRHKIMRSVFRCRPFCFVCAALDGHVVDRIQGVLIEHRCTQHFRFTARQWRMRSVCGAAPLLPRPTVVARFDLLLQQPRRGQGHAPAQLPIANTGASAAIQVLVTAPARGPEPLVPVPSHGSGRLQSALLTSSLCRRR